jgi:hypothetical protein
MLRLWELDQSLHCRNVSAILKLAEGTLVRTESGAINLTVSYAKMRTNMIAAFASSGRPPGACRWKGLAMSQVGLGSSKVSHQDIEVAFEETTFA